MAFDRHLCDVQERARQPTRPINPFRMDGWAVHTAREVSMMKAFKAFSLHDSN